MMQQRRDEILAKKAKLAELKRQRELRATQTNVGRVSTSGLVDVYLTLYASSRYALTVSSVLAVSGAYAWPEK